MSKRAQDFGRVVADALFGDMQQAGMRGPAFEWSHLPEMAERHARASARMCRVDAQKAARAARKRAEELIRDVAVTP